MYRILPWTIGTHNEYLNRYFILHKNTLKNDFIINVNYSSYFQKNASNPVRLTVNTGKSNSSLISRVIEADGMTSLPWWGDNQTNMINGTGKSTGQANIRTSYMVFINGDQIQEIDPRATLKCSLQRIETHIK